MHVYNFSKTIEDLTQLNNKIRQIGLTSLQESTCYHGTNTLVLTFENELSEIELMVLGNFLDQYVEVHNDSVGTSYNVLSSRIAFTQTEWKVLAAWNYAGTANNTMKSLSITGYVDKQSVNDYFETRLYDVMNNTVIIAAECHDSIGEAHLMTLDIDSYLLPFTPTQLEVHAKVVNASTSPCTGYITSIDYIV